MRRFPIPSAVAIGLTLSLFTGGLTAAEGDGRQPVTGWQSPPEDVLEVLHAPRLPQVWTAPGGGHLLLADPVLYPPLAELAAPMYKLAGMRVNPKLNGFHGRHGGTSPGLVRVDTGETAPLDLPDGAVRGSGGTARLVLLPFEDHGYRARETIEHVLWEQLRWFEEHVQGARP